MERRTLLKGITQGVGLATAAIIGLPALVTSLSPVIQRKRVERWRSLGALNDYPLDKVVKAAVSVPQSGVTEDRQSVGVFVWRTGAADVIVYSRSCTDLGCPVTFDEGSEWFYCPCHGGIFDKQGRPRAGPPKIPLHRYDTRIFDGQLQIDLSSIPPMA